MDCVVRNCVLFGAILLFSACAPKEYLKDWQAIDAPAETANIVTLPAFPEGGRQFEIRRTYMTTRPSRWNRRTPSEGYLETLKVADNHGTLEFWREGKLIHTIRLGKCFSFAMMDENHDFAARGAPAYFTAPPDCKVWNGRKWHQSYRTLTTTRTLPCVYEAKRSATVTGSGGARLVRSGTRIHMTEERDGSTKDWSNWVEYDVSQRFFKKFNVGYVGKVEILREIK
ncbi:MAG: hypothetical protein IH831_02320 [Planctomycetes bacterium]|nr:hypothetical protein [Planctomycetota bacterium]